MKQRIRAVNEVSLLDKAAQLEHFGKIIDCSEMSFKDIGDNEFTRVAELARLNAIHSIEFADADMVIDRMYRSVDFRTRILLYCAAVKLAVGKPVLSTLFRSRVTCNMNSVDRKGVLSALDEMADEHLFKRTGINYELTALGNKKVLEFKRDHEARMF